MPYGSISGMLDIQGENRGCEGSTTVHLHTVHAILRVQGAYVSAFIYGTKRRYYW